MSNQAVDIASGLDVSTQLPLNGKTYFKSLAEMQDLGASSFRAFKYYRGMPAYCVETNKDYKWLPVQIGEVGVLVTDFVYPAGLITNGIDYSNSPYNFYEVDNSSINQNNLVYTITVPNQISIGNIVAEINSLPSFTISDQQILIIETSISDIETKLISKIGKGTYGINETQFTDNDFVQFSDNKGQFISVIDVDAAVALPPSILPVGDIVHVKRFTTSSSKYMDRFYIVKTEAQALADGDIQDTHTLVIQRDNNDMLVLIDKTKLSVNDYGVTGDDATRKLFSGTNVAVMASASLFNPMRVPKGVYNEVNTVLTNSKDYLFDRFCFVSVDSSVEEAIKYTNATVRIAGKPDMRSNGNDCKALFSFGSGTKGVLDLGYINGSGGFYFNGVNNDTFHITTRDINVQRGLEATIYNYGKKVYMETGDITTNNVINPSYYPSIRVGGTVGDVGYLELKCKNIMTTGAPCIFVEENGEAHVYAHTLETDTIRSLVLEANSILHLHCNRIIGSVLQDASAELHIYGNPRILTNEPNWIVTSGGKVYIYGEIYPNKPDGGASIQHGTSTIIV